MICQNRRQAAETGADRKMPAETVWNFVLRWGPWENLDQRSGRSGSSVEKGWRLQQQKAGEVVLQFPVWLQILWTFKAASSAPEPCSLLSGCAFMWLGRWCPQGACFCHAQLSLISASGGFDLDLLIRDGPWGTVICWPSPLPQLPFLSPRDTASAVSGCREMSDKEVTVAVCLGDITNLSEPQFSDVNGNHYTHPPRVGFPGKRLRD